MNNKPQPINADDIQKLAHLARLGIDPQELNLFAKDMTRIIDWVSILQAAPTEGLEPLTHPHNECSILRDDIITETGTDKNDHQDLFKNAAHHQNNFFLVPQVIT